MKFLVTGGRGFIGSNLIRFLISEGHSVCSCQRQPDSGFNLLGLDMQIVFGALTDKETLQSALNGCQGVFHLAACGSSLKSDEELRQQINIDATAVIADVVRQAGIRLVHISSVAALGVPTEGLLADERMSFNNPSDLYGRSKHQGEQVILDAVRQGLDAVIVCPGSVVGGHGMKAAQLATFNKIAAGSMRVYPPGGLCVTDVDDLVRGMLSAFEKGRTGERYILGGCNVPYRRYFESIVKATGGKAPGICLPGWALIAIGSLVEKVFPLMGKTPFIDRNTCEMISRNLYFSSEKSIRELGYSIGDLDETIRKAAATRPH